MSPEREALDEYPLPACPPQAGLPVTSKAVRCWTGWRIEVASHYIDGSHIANLMHQETAARVIGRLIRSYGDAFGGEAARRLLEEAAGRIARPETPTPAGG